MGGSVSLDIDATVDPGGSYVNTAEITAALESDPDSTPANASPGEDDHAEQIVTPVAVADLGITKTDGVVSAVPGTAVVYTIAVDNAGPSDVTGASVSDTLDPAIFDVANASWTCAITNGTGACTVPGPATGNLATTVDLTAGSQATYTITAPILSSATGTISNTATVAAPGGVTDPASANDSANDADTVLAPQADLSITKSDGVTGAVPGGTVTYTIVVSNPGPSDVTAATVTDAFDPTYFDVPAVSWTCAVTQGSGTCADTGPASGDISTTVDLTAGSAATFTVTAPIPATAMGTLSNTATLAAPAGFVDPVPTNNAATDDDTVLGAIADLSLAKTVDDPTPLSGASLVFTLTLSNAGPSVATGVTVNDILPAGYSYLSDDSSTSGTSYDPVSGDWVVGSVTPGTPRVLSITARVEPTGSHLNEASVAASDQPDPDSNPGNGKANGEDDESSAGTTPVGTDATVDITDTGYPGDTATITVVDLDMDRDPGTVETMQVVVTNDATGETETVTLTETAPGSGTWQATLATTFGATGADDDGTMATQAGQTVTITYTDALTSSGGSASLSDTMTVLGGTDGTVTMTNPAEPGDDLTITVTDADLDTDSNVAETLQIPVVHDTTGESELVTLTETGPSTGIFEGTLATILGSGPGTDDDGVLETLSGQTATVTYTDSLTSLGGTGTVRATSVFALDAIRLEKTAGKSEAMVGDLVPYTVSVENTASNTLPGITLSDGLPPGFKLVEGTARLVRAGPNGTLGDTDDVVTELSTAGIRPAVFGPFDIAAGEELLVRYVLRVGSGVNQGEQVNTVTPLQGVAVVGGTATAALLVTADPVFDESRVIGKVFEDANRNGVQDRGEAGVANAQVYLDDGTNVRTDEYGRFHFPLVEPGQRLFKLNLRSLAPGTRTTTEQNPIVWISPGLTATVNFGVTLSGRQESIGRDERLGVEITGETEHHPIAVQGRAEAVAALVNGRAVEFSRGDIVLATEQMENVVHLTGNRLSSQLAFDLDVGGIDQVSAWRVVIADGVAEVVRRLEGSGAPPSSVDWDGKTASGELVEPGEVYQYQLQLSYGDGRRVTSTRNTFGVDREQVFSMQLTGNAFQVGRTELSENARATLAEAVQALSAFPDEKLVIEGHTDAQGTEEFNLALSRGRAESAAAYMVEELGFPSDRLVLRWHGEAQPLATNELPEGREVNRRVDLRAEMEEVERTQIAQGYRERPEVRINGESVEVRADGRFMTTVDAADATGLDIEIVSSRGRSATARVEMPTLEIATPRGETLVPYGQSIAGCTAPKVPTEEAPTMSCRLAGRTDRGSSVTVDGREVAIGADGTFDTELALAGGKNVVGLIVSNEAGYSRSANLVVNVADRNASGEVFVVTEAIPRLTVDLPPTGVRLESTTLPLTGTTDPGNAVYANETSIPVMADGRFAGTVELPPGESRLVVRVEDPQGRTGTIEQDVETAKSQLFMIAFGEAEVGNRSVDGFIEAAGTDDEDDFYTEGRLAFYLKGRIKGRYLITAAYDSGRDDLEDLFSDIDGEATRRLLTNLDPDRYYPVYGDDSTVEYDVESQGKLYLALDSEQIHVVLGNYPLSLNGTELSAYQRTLYGGRFIYRSASTTRFGEPDTEVVLFAADVRYGHVRDELRATGGSLYYLSHRDVVEGSEELTIVVRDKNTGLVLSRHRQRQNEDYTIKYEEGRVMFHRPITSVASGGSLFDDPILGGDPVFIQADYETVLDEFEKTASGGRVRQQVGDRVAVGGTYIDDELATGSYTLQGLDAEVRLGANSRVVAEFADSEGTDSLTFVSEDGGLTYTPVAATGMESGSAWKAAAELDVGEWFGRPERYRVGVYYKELESGFFSSGNFLEQGTEKVGLDASLKLTERDTLELRHDREERTDAPSAPGSLDETTLTSALWRHQRERWRLSMEYFAADSEDATGASLRDQSFGSARFWTRLTQRLTAQLEHQQTLSGVDNDQSTLNVRYQALPSLALEVQGTDGDIGSSAQAGAVWTLGESEIYLTERVADDSRGETSSTILGARSRLGRTSKVYSEYQIERNDREDEDKAVSLLGLQKQWTPSPGYRFLLSGEAANVDGATASGRRTVIAGGFSYSNDGKVTALSRAEVRKESGTQKRSQLVTFNKLDYKLGPDFTLQAKYRYSKTRDRDAGGVEAELEERSVGVAYRPVKHDRFNSIFRYTHLFDLRPDPSAGTLRPERQMDVFAIETAYRITPRVEWLGKGAARLQEETFAGLPRAESRSFLTIQRFNVTVWKPIGVGVEFRELFEQESEDARRGFLGEVSWDVKDFFRIGAGYNFTDFTDDELSANDYSVQGWFLRVQGRY